LGSWPKNDTGIRTASNADVSNFIKHPHLHNKLATSVYAIREPNVNY
jgi:hypothetical protein